VLSESVSLANSDGTGRKVSLIREDWEVAVQEVTHDERFRFADLVAR